MSVIAVAMWLWSSEAAAQHPKLDLSIQLGLNTTTYVPRADNDRTGETYGGVQFRVGARLRRRHAFIATDLTLRVWEVTLTEELIDDSGLEYGPADTDILSYSLDLPFLIGAIPYKNPYFKIFLYTGYVNQFNLRFRVSFPGEKTVKVRPREADFTAYQALARFGIAFDVTLFHFDFSYSIGLNSATRTDIRTNIHVLQLNVGMLF